MTCGLHDEQSRISKDCLPLEFWGGLGSLFSFLFYFISKCPLPQGMWESFMNTEKGGLQRTAHLPEHKPFSLVTVSKSQISQSHCPIPRGGGHWNGLTTEKEFFYMRKI